MSKAEMSKAASAHFPCPNPNCSSKVFTSAANRNKHFGAKPACNEYVKEMFAMLLKQQAALSDQKLQTAAVGMDNNNQATTQSIIPEVNEMDDTDSGIHFSM